MHKLVHIANILKDNRNRIKGDSWLAMRESDRPQNAVGCALIGERWVGAAASMSVFEPTPAAHPRIRELPLCAKKRHSNQANKTELPSKHVPIAKIMPSDGCGRDAVPLVVGRWYDFRGFRCHLG